ncbi:MAG TPA: NAD(P)H-binding protein [Thermoanaerobaculia bacterium]|nr:NAD(P)H-binding protein [Thermoanaerobaculia bacterium]HQR65986.1 NAD(P)H-binding protein [Thermoanaerobaculia bacterium]
MRVAVIGASAGVGLETVRQALERGHEVTSLSRRVESLPESPRLRKVRGSSTMAADVKASVDGAEAVLVTLGTGSSTKPTTLYSDSARVLLSVLKETGSTPPLVVLTGFGAGESWDYNAPLMKLAFSVLLRAVYADKSEMERLIAAGYPRWEMVRPGRLTNGPVTGRVRVLPELTKGMKVGAVSRRDVAHFLVAQAERPTFLGKYPALAS